MCMCVCGCLLLTALTLRLPTPVGGKVGPEDGVVDVASSVEPQGRLEAHLGCHITLDKQASKR